MCYTLLLYLVLLVRGDGGPHRLRAAAIIFHPGAHIYITRFDSPVQESREDPAPCAVYLDVYTV